MCSSDLVMAGAIGPASLTEQIFRMVDGMRPHDFLDTVNALDRERQAANQDRWLDDNWNLAGSSTATLTQTLQWLCNLTGWRDPVRGGLSALPTWAESPVAGTGAVYLGTEKDRRSLPPVSRKP